MQKNTKIQKYSIQRDKEVDNNNNRIFIYYSVLYFCIFFISAMIINGLKNTSGCIFLYFLYFFFISAMIINGLKNTDVVFFLYYLSFFYLP